MQSVIKGKLTASDFARRFIAANQAPPRFSADFKETIIEKKFMSVHYKNAISDLMLALRDFWAGGREQRSKQDHGRDGKK